MKTNLKNNLYNPDKLSVDQKIDCVRNYYQTGSQIKPNNY